MGESNQDVIHIISFKVQTTIASYIWPLDLTMGSSIFHPN